MAVKSWTAGIDVERRGLGFVRRDSAAGPSGICSGEVYQMAKQPWCLVLNPVTGGSAATSMNRARRFVKAGRARFVHDNVIEFLDVPLNRRVALSADEALHRRMVGVNIDAISRTMTRCEMAGVPIVRIDRMIRREASGRDWGFEHSVRRDSTRADTPAEVEASRLRQ